MESLTIHTTMCLNLIDFYRRRVPLFLAEQDHGLKYLDNVAEVFKDYFDWSTQELEKQISELKTFIQDELSWQQNGKSK
jgi:glycerol-3-phosphate dehydrogenase